MKAGQFKIQHLKDIHRPCQKILPKYFPESPAVTQSENGGRYIGC